MTLSVEIEQQLKDLTLSEYPKEACALIFSSGAVEKIKNVSEDPKNSFTFCPKAYLTAVLKHPEETFTLWHSHVKKASCWMDIRTPSAKDVAFSRSRDIDSFISGYDGQNYYSSVCFPSKPDLELPLLGRPYIAGIYDCGTLCRDYYLREFGVTLKYEFLPDYLEPVNWPRAVKDCLLVNCFYEANFPLQKGDIICVNYFHMKEAHGLLVTSENLTFLDQRETSHEPDWEAIQPTVASVWRWDRERFLKENL